MKLMIVDDSTLIRKAIETYLSDLDFEIVGEAGDGKQALEIFKNTSPDFVTMDITMPEMDGLTCMEEMLKLKPDTKIMIVTALSKPGIAIEALNKGARHYLRKPFTEEELIASIKKASADA